MRKKAIAWALFAVLSLGLLAGCAGGDGASAPAEPPASEAPAESTAPAESEAPAGEAVALKAWLPPFGSESNDNIAFWNEVMAPFTEETNISVEFEIVPWSNYEEKYLTGITSGMGPDIGYMYLEMIADFIDMGAVTPLDSYLTAEDKENYIFLDMGNVQNQQYMLPISVGGPRILYCNMDILEKSGFTEPPKTWDEFLEVALKIKADSPDVYPFVQAWGAPAFGILSANFYPFLWQNGGDLVDENNEWCFNNEKGVEAVEFLHSLMYEHGVMPETSTSYQEVISLFGEGKAAMFIQSSSSVQDIDDSGVNWDFTISLAEETTGTFISADSLVLMSATEHPDEAFQVMRYLTSGPVMTRVHAELLPEPPVGRDETYSADPRFEEMYTQHVEDFRVLPAVKGSSRVFDILYKNLQLVMLNEMTPQEALDSAYEYAQTLE